MNRDRSKGSAVGIQTPCSYLVSTLQTPKTLNLGQMFSMLAESSLLLGGLVNLLSEHGLVHRLGTPRGEKVLSAFSPFEAYSKVNPTQKGHPDDY